MKIKIIMTILAVFYYGYFICPDVFSQELAFTPKEIVVSAISAYGGERVLREVSDKNSYTLNAALYSPSGIFLGSYYFLRYRKVYNTFLYRWGRLGRGAGTPSKG